MFKRGSAAREIRVVNLPGRIVITHDNGGWALNLNLNDERGVLTLDENPETRTAAIPALTSTVGSGLTAKPDRRWSTERCLDPIESRIISRQSKQREDCFQKAVIKRGLRLMRRSALRARSFSSP